MSILDVGIGIVIGAAFSPFWMSIWAYVKGKWDDYKNQPPTP